MARRKYRFKDRAEAERQYDHASRDKRLAEWLCTAVLDKTNVEVGTADGFTVGYVVLRHSAFVYAFRNRPGIHRISGIWDIDDDYLRDIVAKYVQFEDMHEFSLLLDRARQAAWQAATRAA